MNRPRTEEEKEEARVRTREHWSRVRRAAKLLKFPTSAINKSWQGIEPFYDQLDDQAVREDARQVVLNRCPELRSPDLAGRIKIMMWAIRKCEGEDKARDAFERACRALSDEDGQ